MTHDEMGVFLHVLSVVWAAAAWATAAGMALTWWARRRGRRP